MHEDSEAACGNQVWRGREWAGKFDKPRCVSVGGHFCMQRGTGERRTIFEPARYICVVRAEPARAPPARPSAALIYFMYAPLFQEHATNLKLITMSKSLCNKRAVRYWRCYGCVRTPISNAAQTSDLHHKLHINDMRSRFVWQSDDKFMCKVWKITA